MKILKIAFDEKHHNLHMQLPVKANNLETHSLLNIITRGVTIT